MVIPLYLVAWIHEFSLNNTSQFVVKYILSSDVRVGVPHGCPRSPSAFLVFVNDPFRKLKLIVWIQAFANDIRLWDMMIYRGATPPRI